MELTPPTPLWARARDGGLDDTHAMTVARAWSESDAWGLLLLGGVGRGKSQAAAWLWLRLREMDIVDAQAPGVYAPTGGVYWLRARMLQRLAWSERSEVLRQCGPAYGLIVDEMGAEDERTSEAIGDLVEERGDKGARTVMTTNLERLGFLNRYGDRLTSRLRSGGVERGGSKWAVTIEGRDLRGGEESDDEEEPAEEEPAEPVSEEKRTEILEQFAPEVAALVNGDSSGTDR